MADAKWSTITAKGTPVAADQTLIVDSADGASKLITLDDIPLTGNTELKALATGLLKNTTTTGTPSIATANTDYVTPINPSPSASPGYSGVPVSATNGDGAITHAFGDVCYVDTSGNLKVIDADALASMRGAYVCVGTSAGGPSGTVAPAGTGLYLQFGYLRNDALNWGAGVGGALTIGTAAPIYGTVTGTSGNTCSQVAPASGKFMQILGFPIAAKIWCFNPSMDVFTVA